MKTSKYFYIIVFLCSVLFVNAQFVYNNGAVVQINSGLVVQINGDLENATAGDITNNGDLNITSDITNNATIDGNGTYNISGNWINNSTFNSGTSSVLLDGANQLIGGAASTTFNNLELSGTGIKTLQINSNVNSILALNDRELATGSYTMFVLSTNINAITRTTGFVSSTFNGSLSRATLNTSAYVFPVGSSTGTLRYRPVDITPVSSMANTFTVQMVNNDATTDGYNRALIDTTLCAANPDFYHRINRTAGTSAIDLSIYYDETTDGIWSGIAQWNTVPANIWQNMGTASVLSSTPLSSATISSWNDFTTDPYILTVELPVVDLGPDTFFCTGSYVSINAGLFDSYAWSDGVNTQINDISVADVYFVTVTSQGCTAVDNIKIDEHPNPIAFAGLDTTICEGGTANLLATGGLTYLWSTTETTAGINVSPATTSTYSVTVSDAFCSATDDITVFVNPLPTANAGADENICIGDSVQLIASGGTSYAWSIGSLNQSVYVNPSTTTTYYVTVTENGCSDIDEVIVNVVTSITANAGTDQTICEGNTATLTASGGTNYIWSTTETTTSINVSPTSTTTYFVTASTGSCTDSDSVTVIVTPIPTADAGSDQTICSGSTATLTATGGGTYSWNTSQTGAVINVNPTSNTIYWVTVSLNGCTDYDSVTVNVYSLPTAYAGSDQTICGGDTVILTATGGISYIWSNSSTTQMTQVSPTSTTTYYVTVTDANSCTNYDDVVVTVLPFPNAFAGQDANICEGESIQLSASGGNIYTWVNNTSLSDPNINNPIANPSITTTFIVNVSNGTCSSSDSVTITVFPAPTIDAGIDTTILLSEDAQLHATNTSGTYEWSPTTGLSSATIYNPIINLNNLGEYTYTVMITDDNGCSATDEIHITVIAGDLIIYNTFTPNSDGVNDTWVIDNIDKYPDNIIKVYNRNGHVVFETTNYNNDWDGKYYGNNLPAATYYYVIDLGDGSQILTGDVTIIR